jgi:uncharacterized protein (DUF1800 family)
MVIRPAIKTIPPKINLMDRREFFALKRRVAAPSSRPYTSLRQISTGLTPYSGPWNNNEVVHLLKRTMFGAKKADIDYFKGMSTAQAVDALLNVSATPPAPPVKNYSNTDIAASDPDYGIAPGSTWVNTFSADGTANGKRIASFKSWWTGLMLNQDRTILEKMVLFWHNHFATETNVYSRGIYAYNHNALLRQQALGNFKQLVRQITLDQAMLVYLNGNLNTNTAPDENYGRELQELFTLGKENNPNYTEEDVQAAARVLTGWRIKTDTDDSVYFDATKHDTDNKTFSSFFGGTVITGQTGATAGDTELDALLNLIFSKQTEVSEFIIRKIYRWFCYYTIDADTETNVIRPLAQLFRNNNWEIKPVLSTLFKSEHFFDELNQRCLIKSPVDLLVGACREFNVVFPGGLNAYDLWDLVHYEAAYMQQNMGDPPSVSGWPAYYQLPEFHETWINHATLPRRNIFTDTLLLFGYSRSGGSIQIDPVAFAKTLPNPGDPNAVINDSLDILYRVPLSTASKETIKKQTLLDNLEQDYYWSNHWNAHLTNPGDAAAYQVVYTRLRSLYKYFMNLAEYQLA